MLKFIILIFLVSLSNQVYANNKDQIIDKLENTSNLNFDFEQNINGKVELGNCTIQYPKKMFCKYDKKNKVMVSNGKSLVIKSNSSYYRYPLEKTPLNFILDKNFLINKINELEERIVDKNIINFTIIEKGNEINIFFDNQTYDLIGWQNKDIYQNFNVTFISSIRKNRVLKKNLFKIPSQN